MVAENSCPNTRPFPDTINAIIPATKATAQRPLPLWLTMISAFLSVPRDETEHPHCADFVSPNETLLRYPGLIPFLLRGFIKRRKASVYPVQGGLLAEIRGKDDPLYAVVRSTN